MMQARYAGTGRSILLRLKRWQISLLVSGLLARLASGVLSGIASWCNLSPIYLFSISDVLQVINQMDGSKKKKEIVHGVLVLTCWRIWKERNEKNLINNDVNVV
ncbi:hypothetical protein HanPSC8_Chr12g0502951 [Helianthus annuus]|nr:hypothetical protein HanPSC8_Chr12g0502951 [Helianthus annuus]